MSRFTAVRDGLVAVVEGVTALKAVLKYEPQSAHVAPIAWVILDSYTKPVAIQITTWKFRFAVRVVVPIQNSQEAEDLCVDTAIDVAAAIDANPQFSGVIVNGMATSEDGQTGWIILQGVKCRVVDVFCTAMDKQPSGAL
jgi:hypothetical protein